MSKLLYLVYQDCYKCEGRKVWFEDQEDFARKHHIKIQPLSYITEEAKELIKLAKEAGYSSMLFFTDGEEFGYSVRNFVKSKERKQKGKMTHEPEEEAPADPTDQA